MNWPQYYATFDVGGGNGWSALRVLALLARFVIRLRWKLDLELSPSPAAERVLDAQRGEGEFSGADVLTLLSEDPQVIEGVLIGFLSDPNRPDLIIKSVDGMHWDVYSEDESVLEELERWASAKRLKWQS